MSADAVDRNPQPVAVRADLVVIGAGPAGAAAAIVAARGGLDVVVVDKAVFPREKCCGDGLTTGALRHLEALGLDPSSVPSWQPVTDVHVAGPNEKLIRFPLPSGSGQFAAITRRSELDAALVDLAVEAGATVHQGCSLHGVRVEHGEVVVTAGDLEIGAPHLIAADGMWSPTRKHLGLAEPDYLGDWHAFRQYFTGVSERASSELFVWFEKDLLPGYVWSFPLADGSANVGFGIQRGTRHKIQDMKRLWPDILARPHIAEVLGPDAVPEAPHRAWPIPARLGDLDLTHGPVFFVGDAAAATDPMTGEGIGQALETGALAVECLLTEPDTEAARARYETQLRRGMVRDHGLARALSAVLGTRVGADVSVAIVGATDWTRRNFARWLFEDYPRAVLGTPRRWHRGMLSGAGAYR